MNIKIVCIFLLMPFVYGADYTRPHMIISKQTTDLNLIKPQKILIVQAGKQYGIIPQQVANMSAYLRNRSVKDDVACLDFLDRSDKKSMFDLNIIIPLLWQARTTLDTKPTSPKGSYVELASKLPLATLTDYKKLIRLFITCDALNIECHRTPANELYEMTVNAAPFALALAEQPSERLQHIVKKISRDMHYDDQPILKAIALRIEQLELKNTFTKLDRYCQKINYNFKDFLWPHILAQALLNNKWKATVFNHTPFGISIRDLLVHDALAPKIDDLVVSKDALHFEYTLNLTQSRLNSLDGIKHTGIWMYNYLLRKDRLSVNTASAHRYHWVNLRLRGNEFTTVPDLHLPYLKHLDLKNNMVSTLPDNLDNFPMLEILDLRGNSITHMPDTLIRPGLTILWDQPKD